MKNSKIMVGGLVAIAIAVGAWVENRSSQETNVPLASSNIGVSVPSQRANDGTLKNADQSISSSEAQAPAQQLSQQELQRYSSWMKDRGYAFDISGPSADGKKAMTSYDTMTHEALRQLADSGDRHAAFVLAEDILEKEGGHGLPPKERLAVATKYLRDASALGYTSSLDSLVEIKQKEAIRVGTERVVGMGLDREALVDGYMYAYVLEKRGSPTFVSAMQVLHATEKLTPAEEALARNRANEFYFEMLRTRQAAGLPDFSNELPADIQDTYSKVVAIYAR